MVEGDIIGFVASALVLATFAMKDMRHLRSMAIVSNLAFIAYGAINGLLPVLILHLLLFPLNLLRLIEETRALPSVKRTPSKATLLAIEALQYAGAARPERQSQPALRAVPEPSTRPLQPTAWPSSLQRKPSCAMPRWKFRKILRTNLGGAAAVVRTLAGARIGAGADSGAGWGDVLATNEPVTKGFNVAGESSCGLNFAATAAAGGGRSSTHEGSIVPP